MKKALMLAALVFLAALFPVLANAQDGWETYYSDQYGRWMKRYVGDRPDYRPSGRTVERREYTTRQYSQEYTREYSRESRSRQYSERDYDRNRYNRSYYDRDHYYNDNRDNSYDRNSYNRYEHERYRQSHRQEPYLYQRQTRQTSNWGFQVYNNGYRRSPGWSVTYSNGSDSLFLEGNDRHWQPQVHLDMYNRPYYRYPW